MTLSEQVRKGDLRSVARLISLIEEEEPSAFTHLKSLSTPVRPPRVIGITGPAGAGKSSLINELIKAYRKRRRRVGVLAIDPSSPFSGGAVLGDRLRLRAHLSDRHVYIRSLASRQGPGGLTYGLPQAVRVLGAAGFQTVFVETVGAGQDEVEILGLAGLILVVLAPGIGDEIQAMKAGLLEIGDLTVVHQSDRPEARLLEEELLQAGVPSDRLIRASSRTGEGIEALVGRITTLLSRGQDAERWRRFCRWELIHLLKREWIRIGMASVTSGRLEGMVDRIAAGRDDPYSLCRKVVRERIGGSSPLRGGRSGRV